MSVMMHIPSGMSSADGGANVTFVNDAITTTGFTEPGVNSIPEIQLNGEWYGIYRNNSSSNNYLNKYTISTNDSGLVTYTYTQLMTTTRMSNIIRVQNKLLWLAGFGGSLFTTSVKFAIYDGTSITNISYKTSNINSSCNTYRLAIMNDSATKVALIGYDNDYSLKNTSMAIFDTTDMSNITLISDNKQLGGSWPDCAHIYAMVFLNEHHFLIVYKGYWKYVSSTKRYTLWDVVEARLTYGSDYTIDANSTVTTQLYSRRDCYEDAQTDGNYENWNMFATRMIQSNQHDIDFLIPSFTGQTTSSTMASYESPTRLIGFTRVTGNPSTDTFEIVDISVDLPLCTISSPYYSLFHLVDLTMSLDSDPPFLALKRQVYGSTQNGSNTNSYNTPVSARVYTIAKSSYKLQSAGNRNPVLDIVVI